MKLNLVMFLAAALVSGCLSPKKSSVATTQTFTLQLSKSSAPQLQIDTPLGCKLGHHEGPDFDVFYFSHGSSKGSMGVYIGNHPSLSSVEPGVTGVRRHPGRIGDVPVEWLRWSKNGKYRSEALVRGFYSQGAPPEYADLLLHIFMSAETEQDIARMETTAATLRQTRSN